MKSQRLTRIFATCAAALIVSGCAKDSDPDVDAASSAAEEAVASCADLAGFEYVLCSDPEVRALDNDMAQAVNRLVARSPHEKQADIRAEQSKWAGARDACTLLALPKRRACIDAVYAERMRDLTEALESL